MAEILTGVIALFFVRALVIISRNKYVQWLERKLAMARKELKQLRNERQQPWLTGATTEYHLRNRIDEATAIMENLINKTESIDDGEMVDLEDFFAEMKAWLEDQINE